MSDASIALNRFGLGARPESRVDGDPRRWLLAQLDSFQPRPAAFAAVPPRAQIAGELADYFDQARTFRQQNGGPSQRRRTAAGATAPAAASMPAGAGGQMPDQPRRRALRQGGTAAGDMRDGVGQAGGAMRENDQLAGLPDDLRRYIRQQARGTYVTLVAARTNAALTAEAPFVERLVHFWANHFAISIDKLPVIALGGMMEFEAIRPHVTGKFRDLLLAVERHPAMLLYLDQAQSVGPNAPLLQLAARFGRGDGQRRAGLNENLGREILELHTLGVGGGYTQADVTELARALTGWSVAGLMRGPRARFAGVAGQPGDFAFAAVLHEPGARTIMGKTYAQEGEAQARAVLADLAAHPATARHLCTKLARHFVGDTPPPALVERMTRTYLASDGDLSALYRLLVAAPEAWAPQPAKFKSPWEWAVSSLRAIGARDLQGQAVVGLTTQLGQPVWRPGSPAGWDDIASAWAGPDALLRRVEAAERLAGRTADRIDARQLAQVILPGAVSPATAQSIERAESPGQGLALLLASPEFMRR